MDCCCSCIAKKENIMKLEFSFIDWIKTLISWIFSYRKTYDVEPGLYFTGKEYDINSPLLVTCNYHMTVFLLWRILKGRNVRILVIDTKGINVWCSSGKGQFSAKVIIDQLAKYDRKELTKTEKLEIILPKLSLSGVRLSELRKADIVPKIGPIYAQNLPEYLDEDISDCDNDHYKFNLRNRLFTLLPSFIQFTKYILISAAILFIINLIFKTKFWWQILPVSLSIPILYVVFFPLLPAKNFSFKGITLFAFQILIVYLLFGSRLAELSIYIIAFHLLFYLGTNIFFGLYYTGNSGVSNYSLVKKEIITFLPIVFVLYLGALTMIILQGVLR
jgi:hypothetical protein